MIWAKIVLVSVVTGLAMGGLLACGDDDGKPDPPSLRDAEYEWVCNDGQYPKPAERICVRYVYGNTPVTKLTPPCPVREIQSIRRGYGLMVICERQ